MLYLGHFCYTGEHPSGPLQGQEMSGHFSCLVEADDPESAGKRFLSLIRASRRSSDAFDGIADVFLDTMIAVKSLPKKGVVTHLAQFLQPLPDSVSIALPDTSGRFCDAFSFESDEAAEEEGDQVGEAEPFVSFVSEEPVQ
jgi:hypothetical protein